MYILKRCLTNKIEVDTEKRWEITHNCKSILFLLKEWVYIIHKLPQYTLYDSLFVKSSFNNPECDYGFF